MIGLLLITHGQLAEDILKAAESIAGPVEMVECVTVDVIKDSEQLIGMIEKKIGSLDHGKGVLVLTDMLGGTPSNVAMSFLQENKVEIITGINLPMLIAVAHAREGISLAELADKAKKAGLQSISLASELLKPAKK